MPDQNQPNDLNQNPVPGNTPNDPTVPTRPNLTTEEVATPSAGSGQATPPTQDPSQPATPADNTPPPMVPETTDVPPPPPGPEPTDTVVPPTSNIQPPTSSFDLPPIVGTPPKKKFGGKKVISTILGLLLLVGGIGAGVTLVRQQQDIREQAKINEPCKVCSGKICQTVAKGASCNSDLNECKSNSDCGGGASFGECQGGQKRFVDCTTKLNCPGKVEEDCVGGKFVTVGNQCQDVADNCPAGKKGESSSGGGGGGGLAKGLCSNSSAAQCQNQPPGKDCHEGRGTCKAKGDESTDDKGNPICICKVPETGCVEECPSSAGLLRSCTPPDADGTPVESICNAIGRVESCGGKSYCCPVVGGKWTTNMSACQGSAQCLNIKAYDTNFNQLTADQLKALKVGDKVRFAVAGTATGASGSFDKAKFKINSTDSGEVTTKKPSSEEFYYEFTIPDGTTSFNITAQIHHTVLGWSN